MKTGRMMFSTILLCLTLLVEVECIKLPENFDIIRELTDTIHRLEDKITELEKRVAETEAERDEEMKKMQQKNNDLSQTIRQLEVKVAETDLKRDEEKRLTTDSMTTLAEGLAQIEVKTADIERQTEEFAKFKEQQASLQVASAVSFSASANYIQYFPEVGEIFSFPHVMTNNGGHYNPDDSVFTCPVNGSYYFSSSLYTTSLSEGKRTSGLIQIDEEGLRESYCHNEGSGQLYIQCGISVVTQCHRGQRVFITTAIDNTQYYGASKRTTFSGFLIHTDA